MAVVKRAGRWLTGFAPLWLECILLNLQALDEMKNTREQAK